MIYAFAMDRGGMFSDDAAHSRIAGRAGRTHDRRVEVEATRIVLTLWL
jgi:hypothetical protein